ncbi:related to MDN1 Midasin, pseudo-hexameric assembly of AAA protomers, associated with 60S pre-ribosomes (large subunit precursor) [Cephalotrichum gorgonifer]|uniref:Related to MDN1 Midasin, pseudo-hexameric assembly of AAA protomers, associated with 60S pre-ribosomes (Large subunit) n=1 Tax=Cephalotrichum gorgonifer TaxID=2041049 RepID=A0AAE8N1B4_9PEZI|nr:related to MDN1 Midasin, pseudo-hexameric assembly of AAA protomers, associated with 60S pre-ribosomes (large subunit precursor) [Cephalotrichum gorgonifer]
MLTSKLNLPLPGGWTKDPPTSGENTPGNELAAGIVGETGQVLDQAGKPVARVTEGEPKELTGFAVAPSGDIINGSGEKVGAAVPLTAEEVKSIPTQPEQKNGGVDLGRAARSTKGAYDTLNKIPGAGNLAGQIGRGLGFGGPSKGVESEVGAENAEEMGGEVAKSKAGIDTDALEIEQSKTGASLVGGSEAPIDMEDRTQLGEEGDLKEVLPEAEPYAEGGDKTNETLTEDTTSPEDEKPAEGEGKGESQYETLLDYSVLKNCQINKLGNVVNPDNHIVGRIVEGNPKDLLDRKPDENGDIWNDSGKVIGKAVPVPLEESKEPSPFEDFPQAVVESGGFITFEGKKIGRLVEGDAKKLKGKTVDEDGDVLDRAGNVLGRAERWEEESEPEDQPVDYSVLAGKSVNKAGNIVDSTGSVYGRLVEGDPKRLVGRTCDKEGLVHDESGDVVGKAEPVTREESRESAPFEDFPDATVEEDGTVTFEGIIVGRLIQGDAKKLKGKKVDEDGDILDRAGNNLGKAERWEEEEPEPEVVDNSILAGKRINKLGWAVDGSGTIFGRLIEGDAKRLAGRMCDKDGNVRSESGDKVGKVELVPEGEREGVRDGPFAELPGCTVTKEGKIVTSAGDIVGRLTEGDGKRLFGRAVDEDGDVLDKNGNTIGKAERWEEEVVEEPKNPMCGRKINREGNCVDEDGNVIGRLTSGELTICAGKTIDNDGDVVDRKGNTVGHASLLEDILVEEETETVEEKEKREKDAEDKNLAQRMATCLEQCLDKIKPICTLIKDKIDKAESTDKDDLDEESLVKEVKPLLEQGHNILAESNGIIRGLDPDGHIQANAKHKTAAREATPEEYHLADVLKEITGTVTETIENSKKKLEGMPHAKKALNPLWALLTEPLGQIIAAVGLLLNGVLELVGRLLNGLGLGGLVNNLLGGLGLTSVLKSLGVGSIVDSLTGQKSKK